MNSRTRIRPAWPGWLVWALPASIGLVVIGYQIIYQVTINSARSTSIFWGEVLVFGIVGPLIAWLLLRQLALDATESRAAAAWIESLAAEEQRHAHEMTALYVVSAAMNQALSEEDALTDAFGRVLDVLELTSGRIYVIDSNSGLLTLAAAQGEPALLTRVRRPSSSANACAASRHRPANWNTQPAQSLTRDSAVRVETSRATPAPQPLACQGTPAGHFAHHRSSTRGVRG